MDDTYLIIIYKIKMDNVHCEHMQLNSNTFIMALWDGFNTWKHKSWQSEPSRMRKCNFLFEDFMEIILLKLKNV